MVIHRINAFLNHIDQEDIDCGIAEFIKNNVNQIPNMKIDEVASQCFVSKGKLSTFCKKLGYQSFGDLKRDCVAYQNKQRQILINQRKSLDKDYLSYLHDSMDSIIDSLESVNIEKLEQFVQTLHQYDHVYLYGLAYSHLLCQYIQNEFALLDKEVTVLDQALFKEYHFEDNALIVLMTIDGYGFDEQHRTIRKLKTFGTKVLCLCTDKLSPKIIEQCDEALVIPSDTIDNKERRIVVRYLLDAIIGRYQYLYTE